MHSSESSRIENKGCGLLAHTYKPKPCKANRFVSGHRLQSQPFLLSKGKAHQSKYLKNCSAVLLSYPLTAFSCLSLGGQLPSDHSANSSGCVSRGGKHRTYSLFGQSIGWTAEHQQTPRKGKSSSCRICIQNVYIILYKWFLFIFICLWGAYCVSSNLLCELGQPQTHKDPPASAFEDVGIKHIHHTDQP